MMVKDKNAKGMLNQPVSNDPYSNQFPITGPPGERYNNHSDSHIGMADLDVGDGEDDELGLIVESDDDEGPGMKDGGLIGSHSYDR